MRNGHIQSTVLLFAIFFALLPASVCADTPGLHDASIAEFEQLLEQYPDSEMRARLLLLLGNLYMEREKDRYLAAFETEGGRNSDAHLDYSEAIVAFRVASESGDDCSLEAIHAMGVCYDEMNLRTEAAACFQNVAALARSGEIRLSALLRMGSMYYAASKWDEALDSYLQAVESGADPSSRKLDYRIGWCHLKRGELAEAEERLMRAARRVMEEGSEGTGESSLPEILRSLALVRVETDPHGVVEYAALFTDGPPRRIALSEMGEVLLDHDLPASAEKAFRLALAVDPNSRTAPELHERVILSIGARDAETESGREMELFAELYRPGGMWWEVNGPDHVRADEVRSMIWRNNWNAALLRFDAGSEEDHTVAARLFDACAAEATAGIEQNRARLFAAEAWYALEEYSKSARRYLEIETAGLSEEERRNVLQGAVLALKESKEGGDALVAAALRYVDHFPGDPDAEKTLFLVSGIEEEEGRTESAAFLAGRAAESADTELAAEASLRAARLASLEQKWEEAEEWFSTAAGHAKNDTVRNARLERAAASAYLRADALRSSGCLRDAADSFARIFRKYRKSTTAGDALLGNMVCLAGLGEEGGLHAQADSASRLLAGNDGAAGTLREYAASASRSFPNCSAVLYRTAHSIAPETGDLLKAGFLFEKSDSKSDALACYIEQASGKTDRSETVRASFRAGILLAGMGRHLHAAESFEKNGGGAVDPDTNRIEALVRAGSCRLQTDDPERAAECYSLAIRAASERDALPAREELFLARAHIGAAGLALPSFRKEASRWRGGEKGRKASDKLKTVAGHYRASIALGFEETNREAAKELASALEFYGRIAFLREWERGNIPAIDILEPFYQEASALFASLPKKSRTPRFLYTDLADTLILMGIHEIDSSPPPESFEAGDDFDRYSRLVATRLRAIDSADRKWRSARLLSDMRTEGTVRAGTDTETARIALPVLAGTAIEEGAEFLRNTASPPGLSDDEEIAYRAAVEERSRALESRAAEWYRTLPGSDPGLAPPRISVLTTGSAPTEEYR